MKRPNLIHFMAIKTDDTLAIKASVSLKKISRLSGKSENPLLESKFPIQAYRMLVGRRFTLKICAYNSQHLSLFTKTFETDSFGNINIKIPLRPVNSSDSNGGEQNQSTIEVSNIQVYETSYQQGIEYILGSYIPLSLTDPKKIVVCDFDKTLVETKYSSTMEVYDSLTRPIHYFPTIEEGLDQLRSFIEKSYHPFILSASPHFYEESMRDWLYQHKIYSAGIFLKDYRQILSFFEGDLAPKDIKQQGLYKLNHLLDIIMMTGIPAELVLIGDNFESDPLIYLSLLKLFKENMEPWVFWKMLKRHKAFSLSKKQNSQLLNKIHHLNNLIRKYNQKNPKTEIKILIRKKYQNDQLSIPEEFHSLGDRVHLF